MTWSTGELKWTCDDRDLKLDFGGSFVRVADKLITMSQKGVVSLVKATPEGCKKISQFPAFEDAFDEVWSTPVIYQGKLYCKGQDTLACFNIGSK
jgi:hypothetical protein